MDILKSVWDFIKSPRGKALIQLGGGALGGLMGYKLSQPSAAAKQAIEQILASDTFNAEQVQALMGMMPELMDIYKESVPRARLQLDNATKTVDRASELFDAADAQFNRAEEAYQPALQYGTDLLKGGPTAMQAISPEVSAVRSQGEQFRSQLSQLAPRGGGRSMTLMQLPGQEQQQITNLLSQARQFGAELVPKVAAGLGDLAVGRTGLGQGVTNLAGTQGDLAKTEAAIGQIAGQLGMSAAELAARWQQIRLYGPQSILDYDIRNRMLQLPIMQAGGQAGGNIAGSLYDIIFDGDGGGGRSRGGSIIGTPDFNPNAANSPNPYNNSVIDLTDLYSRKGTNSASRTTYGGGGR